MADAFKITNLGEFNAELKKVLRQNKDIRREIVTEVSIDGLRELQRTTPRDSGRARAGWNNTVNRDPSEWKPTKGQNFYPLTPFKDTNLITEDTPVNLSNNVEYIIPLDKGHSPQNKNMVAKAVAKLTAQLSALTSKEGRRKVR